MEVILIRTPDAETDLDRIGLRSPSALVSNCFAFK